MKFKYAESFVSFLLKFTQPEVPSDFRSDDVVLMTTARDEKHWLSIARSCKQTRTRLLVAPADQEAAQFADRIRSEKVTVVITTGRQWLKIYRQLNRDSGDISRLQVIVTDSFPAPKRRTVFLPRAFSQAKIVSTYEAYQKAPWNLINLR